MSRRLSLQTESTGLMGRLPGAALAFILSTSVSADAGAQTFLGLGPFPSGAPSSVTALSRDGTTAAGNFVDAAGPHTFRWRQTGGWEAIPPLPGSTGSYTWGISGDGEVLVGTGGATGATGVRWSAASGTQATFGTQGSSICRGASQDGSVIVGQAQPHPIGGSVAARWTSASGTVFLGAASGGSSSIAVAVSPDGSVVVGKSAPGDGTEEVFRWTAGTGMVSLGNLPGQTHGMAYGVSGDGQVVVGQSGPHAFRWTEATGMVDLGILPGNTSSVAYGTSDDGRLVVGGAMSSPYIGFIWTAASGMSEVSAFVQGYGVDLAGWTELSVSSVSADGRVFAGGGKHNGVVEGWVFMLPCRADFNVDDMLDVQDIFDFLNAWFANDPRADFNATDGITVQDIFDYLNAWFAGC